MFVAFCDAGEGIPLIYADVIDRFSNFACAERWTDLLDLIYNSNVPFTYIYEFIPGQLGYATRWRRNEQMSLWELW